MRDAKHVVPRKAVAFLCMSVLMFGCLAAVAQQGGRGAAAMDPAQAAKAWELEAKNVAKSIGLSDEQTTKLVDAYKAARQSYATAARAQMSQGERPNMQAMLELNKSERAKLAAALEGTLTPEQAEKALASLGSFNWRWDSMVLALDGMGLEEAKKEQALTKVADYVAETAKAREAAAGGGDMQAMREKGRELREKLDADLGQILSAEQLAQWKEATAMRRGPGAGGRGAGGGGAAGQEPAPAPAPGNANP